MIRLRGARDVGRLASVASIAFLIACGGGAVPAPAGPPVVACVADERAEQRPLRDCGVVRADLERDASEVGARLDALTIDPPERDRARQALSTLADGRRRLCDDWNACGVERGAYATRDETLATRRAEFGRYLADAAAGRSEALVAWSHAVLEGTAPPTPAELALRDAAAADRIAAAREQQADTLESERAQLAQRAAAGQRMQADAMAAASARMREVVSQAELHMREADEALAVLAIVRTGTVDAAVPTAPPICADHTALERVRMLSVAGTQLNWDATGLVRSLDDICGRIERWHTPDERSRPAIASYVQKLHRIEGWMHDIRGCLGTSGRDAARCENAYGRTQDAEAAEARAVETIVAAHLRELAGVDSGARPFPCTTPTLARVEGMTFVGSVARAQMTSLPRDAERVCTAIGVSESALRDAMRALRIRLDQTESTLRSQRRAQQNLAETMRAQLGD